METLEQQHKLPTVHHALPVVCNGTIYDVLERQSVQEAIHCLITTFPANEPMTKHLGISQAAFYDFADMYVRKAVEDGLSIAAIDISTGKLVGCQISEDFEGEPPAELDHLPPQFDPILALIDTLDSNYKTIHLTSRNEILHEFMMGVYPNYKRRNIGYNLLKVSHTLGRMKGFQGAISEVTGPISQHIFNVKHHYQILQEIQYNMFTFHERTCFEGMPDGATCQLVYKDLHFSHYKKNLIRTHQKKSLRPQA